MEILIEKFLKKSLKIKSIFSLCVSFQIVQLLSEKFFSMNYRKNIKMHYQTWDTLYNLLRYLIRM